MTEYKKMCNGLLYDFGSPEIEALFAKCKEKLKLLKGVRIGDRVIIGAGSVVVHDIPSDTMAAGNPAVV